MEEAYTALYQEFLRLQLLCFKQAAMLQRLTEALRRHQGAAPVSNGDLEDLVSVPVQCRHAGLGTSTHPGYQAQAAQSHTTAIQPPGPAEAQTSALVREMNGLHLDPAQDGPKPNLCEGAEPLDSAGQSGTEMSDILDELRQVERNWHSSRADRPLRRPWSSSFLTSEMLSEAGGMLMSRVTLQSQVCEFCHAVFPGHTTTQGEFLRHLHTHLS